MKDLLVIALIAIVGYVFTRVMLKEPILPFGEKKAKSNSSKKNQNQSNNKKTKNNNEANEDPLDEKEAAPFKDLFPNFVGFESHMIRYEDNEFAMVAEVDPVNYFLRDSAEQNHIDASFETWLATLNYPVRIYLQNRFVDLSEQIASIKKTMAEQEDLNFDAREYGEQLIGELERWQTSQPRYDLKRYLIFDFKVDVKELKYSATEDEDERIVDKAFGELHRRVMAARTHLRSGEMDVQLLSTDGLVELSYYTFNRRKALKNKYRDIANKEQLALYVTADQSAEQIAAVKGAIDSNVQ